METALKIAVCLFLVLASGFAQSKRIAVYDFDSRGIRSDVIEAYGSEKPVGAHVAARVISKLVNSKEAFDVIDRNQIDSLMREQNSKFSERFDPRDAPKLGRLLNVDAIVTGAVESLSSEVQNNRMGVGRVGIGKVQAVAEVTVSMRVISTETGRIFMAETTNAKRSRSLGNTGSVGGKGGADSTSANRFPGAQSATLALQTAADDLAAKIVEKASTLPTRKSQEIPSASTGNSRNSGPPAVKSGSDRLPQAAGDVTALSVGRVAAGKVYITAGENAGLNVNDYLEVRRVTGSMKDDRGNSINTDERVETLVVTDVQDRFAVAELARGGTPAARVGDKLKRVKSPPASPRRPTTPRAGAPAQGALNELPAPVRKDK